MSVTLRLWGPVKVPANLSTVTGFGVWRGQKLVFHDAISLRATKNTLARVATIEGFDGDAFYGNGLVTRSYPAGRYAEVKFSTRIRTPGQICISCVRSLNTTPAQKNVSKPSNGQDPDAVPRFGGPAALSALVGRLGGRVPTIVPDPARKGESGRG